MKRYPGIVALVAAFTVMVAASAHQPPVGSVESPDWIGNASFKTETFEASGTWEITLGAWCFEGVGFVRVVAFDSEGEEVGRTIVLGEGIESAILETEPGEYYLEVTVSHWHTYNWQLAVEPVDGEVSLEEADDTGGDDASY